jgi:hypothetical protein
MEEPPGAERVDRPDHSVHEVVLTRVDDGEDDRDQYKGLRGKKPGGEAMLADDKQSYRGPRGVQGWHRGDDVVARRIVLASCELSEAEVVKTLLDDMVNLRDQPVVAREPRGAVGATRNVISPMMLTASRPKSRSVNPRPFQTAQSKKARSSGAKKCDAYMTIEKTSRGPVAPS